MTTPALANGSGNGLTIKLEAFGLHGVRIRVAPANKAITEPLHPALLPEAPPTTPSVPSSSSKITSGNLMVEADASTGLITATRLSDGQVVLKQNTLTFTAPMTPVSDTKAGKVGVVVAFDGHGSNESIYGLGEHRTGKVNQMPYSQV
jgi:hypothetical protein